MVKAKTVKKVKKVEKVLKSTKPAREVKAKVEKVEVAPKVVLEDDKQKIIDKFGQKKGDTGSPEVQAALLSLKIDKLAEHLEINKKDNHSRRGLLKVIAKRRRILNYLQKLDEKRYKTLIKEIGLKK
ncbi:30S ribosomal protein S15 [Candidatus Roizmanbacteria bacterium]|nr:30S ribosomal protein S15 [Candidatus Roizmanbacteria bacterium]